MKKILTGIVCLLAAALIFADSSGAIEGAVEVAGKGDLPAGYFGKAAGYLPGDTVSIVNPQTGFMLQILNLGTLDASEGTAVLLSQESAQSLGLSGVNGVRVRLEPRSGFFDETAAGKAVLEKSTLPAKKPEAPVAVNEPQAPAPAAAVAAVSEPAVIPQETDGESEISGSDAEEEYEIAVEEEIPADDIESAEAEEEAVETAEAAEEAQPEEAEADFLAASPVLVPQDGADSLQQPVVVEGPAGEPPVPEQEVVVVELPALEQEIPEEDYESEEDSFIESREAVEQPSPAEEAFADEGIECEEAVAEEFEAEELSPAEEIDETEEAEAEETVVAEEPVEEAESAEEECEAELLPEEDEAEPSAAVSAAEGYEPIILVPAEPEASPALPSAPEKEAAPAVPEISPAQPEPQNVPFSLESYIVSSENSLETGCYYIQIATLGNEKNIKSVLSAYSKYPVVLVPNGKGAYRVLIGPLSVDEYGAVLAKCKDAGFADAFVRKR